MLAPAALQPPVHSSELKVDFPADHVLLLTLNRPRSLNAMTPTMGEDLRRVLDWFENEPQLWWGWSNSQQQGETDEQARVAGDVYGFGALSRRQCVKPVIAAVAGGAYGGGTEIVLNSDIVIAGTGAKFALPEVKRGVVAIQGGIPRLAQIVGHQLASEMLLLGRTIDAAEAQTRFGFVNRVVPPSEVLSTALAVAREIAANSPDAVQSTKEGLLLSQRLDYHQTHLAHAASPVSTRVYKGTNIKEGLRAFAEKRAPVWKNPAKL
ncbi:hypothetical protein C0992_001313 [Termitomyces sp. T32_za158]|nr:hypothetical protein C0992_001313 [Termitomyces sp. T32_za158]